MACSRAWLLALALVLSAPARRRSLAAAADAEGDAAAAGINTFGNGGADGGVEAGDAPFAAAPNTFKSGGAGGGGGGDSPFAAAPGAFDFDGFDFGFGGLISNSPAVLDDVIFSGLLTNLFANNLINQFSACVRVPPAAAGRGGTGTPNVPPSFAILRRLPPHFSSSHSPAALQGGPQRAGPERLPADGRPAGGQAARRTAAAGAFWLRRVGQVRVGGVVASATAPRR